MRKFCQHPRASSCFPPPTAVATPGSAGRSAGLHRRKRQERDGTAQDHISPCGPAVLPPRSRGTGPLSVHATCVLDLVPAPALRIHASLLQLLLRHLVETNGHIKAADLPIALRQCGRGARHPPIVDTPGGTHHPSWQKACSGPAMPLFPGRGPVLHVQVLDTALLGRRTFPNHPRCQLVGGGPDLVKISNQDRMHCTTCHLRFDILFHGNERRVGGSQEGACLAWKFS